MNTPLPIRALPAPDTRPPLVVAALALGSALAYLFWLRLGGGGLQTRSIVVSALFIALDVVLVVLFRRAAANPVLSAGTARALRYLAAAAGVALCGRTIVLYALLAGMARSAVSVAPVTCCTW